MTRAAERSRTDRADSTAPALITLTTDFGASSPYIAQMKGVILGLNRHVTVVDLTHTIGPQNIRQAALVLCDSTPLFPPDTIHICVVDPGVGTRRAILYAELGSQRFIAPDNGVLSLVAQQQTQRRLFTLTEPAYWREAVSNTFHGRDIMASVAAHLSLGVAPQQLGPGRSVLQQLEWPPVTSEGHAVQGSIVALDSFGNLISNVTRAMLPPTADLARHQLHVELDGQGVELVPTYGAAAPGETVALFGSSDRMEIAVVNGNAARELKADVGQVLRVSWESKF